MTTTTAPSRNHPGWIDSTDERTAVCSHSPEFCTPCAQALRRAEGTATSTGSTEATTDEVLGGQVHRATWTSGPRYTEAKTERRTTERLQARAATVTEQLTDARVQLTRSAERGTPTTLHDMVQDLAVWTEQDRLWEQVRERTTRTDAPLTWSDAARVTARVVVRNMVNTGVDDTWSGRGNDLRRTVYEARRVWVEHVVELLGVELL